MIIISFYKLKHLKKLILDEITFPQKAMMINPGISDFGCQYPDCVLLNMFAKNTFLFFIIGNVNFCVMYFLILFISMTILHIRQKMA